LGKAKKIGIGIGIFFVVIIVIGLGGATLNSGNIPESESSVVEEPIVIEEKPKLISSVSELILTRSDVVTMFSLTFDKPKNSEHGLDVSVLGSHEVKESLGFQEVMSQTIWSGGTGNFKINFYKFDSAENAKKIFEKIKEKQYQRGGFIYYGTQVKNADCYGLQKEMGTYTKFSLYCVKVNVYYTIYSAIVYRTLDQVDLGPFQHDFLGQKVSDKFI